MPTIEELEARIAALEARLNADVVYFKSIHLENPTDRTAIFINQIGEATAVLVLPALNHPAISAEGGNSAAYEVRHQHDGEDCFWGIGDNGKGDGRFLQCIGLANICAGQAFQFPSTIVGGKLKYFDAIRVGPNREIMIGNLETENPLPQGIAVRVRADGHREIDHEIGNQLAMRICLENGQPVIRIKPGSIREDL